MDDLTLIDCVERMRTYLAGCDPRFEERRQAVRERDYRSLSTDELQAHLVCVALDIDISTAAGQRRCEMALHQLEQVQDSAGHDDEPHGTFVLIADSRRRKQASLLRRSLTALRTVQLRDSFVRQLEQCAGLHSAAACAAKNLPALRGQKVYEFLARIGYPAAVPSRDTMRLLHRLGLIHDVKDDSQGRRDFFDSLDRISSTAALPLPELDLLLGSFARGNSRLGLKAVCAPEPRCSGCVISSHCVSFRYRGMPHRVETTPIKHWARDERPRERLLEGERLSSAELLGIILRTGSGSKSAVDLGREIISKFGSLHRLEAASPQEIMQKVAGIGPAKAAEIRAAIELGRRVVQPAADERDSFRQVSSSQDVFNFYRPRYKSATQEEFLLLALNTKNRIQREISVSVGTINASIVHPRDVFNHALREAAAGVIFVHNHPSGDPAPSPEDHALTRRLVEAGNLLGIKVLDHVIIGAQRYYSFADEGALC